MQDIFNAIGLMLMLTNVVVALICAAREEYAEAAYSMSWAIFIQVSLS